MTETTREIPFRDIPVEQRPLLLIASGVGVATALREAADLEDVVRRLLLMGTETGLDGGVAYLSSGPSAGTRVVTVGVPELYGIEEAVGH